jgi:hypothetical protein
MIVLKGPVSSSHIVASRLVNEAMIGRGLLLNEIGCASREPGLRHRCQVNVLRIEKD